jgi:hypothetical protein
MVKFLLKAQLRAGTQSSSSAGTSLGESDSLCSSLPIPCLPWLPPMSRRDRPCARPPVPLASSCSSTTSGSPCTCIDAPPSTVSAAPRPPLHPMSTAHFSFHVDGAYPSFLVGTNHPATVLARASSASCAPLVSHMAMFENGLQWMNESRPELLNSGELRGVTGEPCRSRVGCVHSTIQDPEWR